MKITTRFSASTQAWEALLQRHTWNVFIYGGQQSQQERRCKSVFDRFAGLNTTIGINRQDSRHSAYQLNLNGVNKDCDGLVPFKQALDAALPSQALHVMLDLTSLELDIILYVLPLLLEKTLVNLFGLYLIPKSYRKRPEERLNVLSIAQPSGYISFLPGIEQRTPNTAHFFLCGFDHGRAQRFIDQYDWDTQQIHAVIGDPAYVPDGVQKVKDANCSWQNQLPTSNIHRIDAHLADNVRLFFCEQFARYELLDVIPQGPKPMLLGFLLFYLPLSEKERERIRILYDFPTPRKGRTTGISHGFLYDCNALISYA